MPLFVRLGLGRLSELRRHEEYDEQMRSKYVDPVEAFPEKMDQLMAALERVRWTRVLTCLCENAVA